MDITDIDKVTKLTRIFCKAYVHNIFMLAVCAKPNTENILILFAP